MATSVVPHERIAAVREFNRYYTRRIGVLKEHLLASDFTLPESRLLWELAHREDVSAADLARDLELDAGYLSRLLRGLRERGLVRMRRCSSDARRWQLALTAAGRRAFAPLDQRSQQEVGALLQPLPPAEQERLLSAMGTITGLLQTEGGARVARAAPVLRDAGPGDLGWIVGRHGAIYAQEHGWDWRFEAMVARIAADYVERLDARREGCWIATHGGRSVGSVMLVRCRDATRGAVVPGVAQLRLLLVEPSARGLGVGRTLVAHCTAFAREHGYRRIRLWTNSLLLAARALYEQEGYRRTASEAHRSFGHHLVGETWELTL